MTLGRFSSSVALACAASALAAVPSIAEATSSATRQLPGMRCSVTANLTVASPASGPALRSGGGVSCAGGAGQKTLNVVPQVEKRVDGRARWFTISLAGLYQGPTPANPVRLAGDRTAVAGHVYRVLVAGRVTSTDGRTSSATACAGSGCANFGALSLRPSDIFAAQPPATVPMRDVQCSVAQHGLRFTVVNGSWVLEYGGDAFCASGVSTSARALSVCAQVANRAGGRTRWYSIAGSCLTSRTSSSQPLTLHTARSAFLGHAYRVKVLAEVTTPAPGGQVTRTLALFSGAAAP